MNGSLGNSGLGETGVRRGVSGVTGAGWGAWGLDPVTWEVVGEESLGSAGGVCSQC